MIAPTSRPIRLRLILLLALAVTSTLPVLTLAACGSPNREPVAHVSDPASSQPATGEPEPTETAPTESPVTTNPPSSTPPPPADPTLASYLARLPRFGPPPRPEPVWLPHQPGQAAFAYQIPTSKPVAFLTIDDGINRHPMALELLKAAKVPVTLFLTTNYVSGHANYFQALKDTGYVTIENHTVSHPKLPEAGYDGARSQLCNASDRLAQWFGTRPTFFRPPFGEKSAEVLAAAWDCGLHAGFHWRETVDSGNVYYQRDAGRIHAGDIILMHFRPAFPDDFVAALTAIHNSGLSVGRLEDYVRVDGVDPHSEPAPTEPAEPTSPPQSPPLADAPQAFGATRRLL